MLFKPADDKTPRLRLLEALQQSTLLDRRQKEWLKSEHVRVKRGLEGEREAAFHIDSLMRDGPNTAVLHDLRLEVDGETAQIDHLVFNRMLDFILVETKCYSGDVQINAAGEFTVQYGKGKRHGVASPLAQSERHGRVLAKVLERVGISGRLGTRPKFHHLVMFHPKAIITRPPAESFDTSNVIKADHFAQWRERWMERAAGGSAVSALLNLRGRDTLKDWAELLCRAHQPADLLALPDFMRPAEPQRPLSPSLAPEPAEAATADAAEALPRRLICATCGAKLSFAEGRFCWNQPERFGGLQYCRAHQAAVG